MLIYFKVGNFKSVKDPVVINFNAANISEHTDSNVIKENGIELIRSILLYGHNASGKSKILDALRFYRTWILHSVEPTTVERFEPDPFVLSEETEQQPSYFEAAFILENIKFRYGFTVNRNKIHTEWLLESKTPSGKEYPVFLRGDEQFQIDYKRFENAESLESKTRIDALFLSVASQWNVEKALNIVKWFKNIQVIHGIDKNRFSRRTVEFLLDERYSSIIKELINKADLGISDLGIRELEAGIQTDLFGNNVSEYEINYRRLNVYTVHTKFNSENLPTGNVRFSLNKDESEGTIKYFDIIGQLLFALQNNSLIVIDEFDARLHTLLSKAIIRLFNSSKSKSKAQLFVASHDTALLDRRLLRRDQIYFVNKNQYGASEVTALVEYKTRKESPYDKNYLEGKYGAIPFIEEFESFLKNAE